MQFCLATFIIWYSYGINRRASKKAWLAAFCIQGWIPALWFIFLDLHMMQWNALTHSCLTITLQHYIKRGLRRWWQAEGSNRGKWQSWLESLWLLQPVFTGTSICPTGKLSEPRMILDYHTCLCPRLHFSILTWLKGCNHSSQSRNPYCHLWIMSCWTRSKARHQGMYSKCTKKLKLLQNADDCQLNRLFLLGTTSACQTAVGGHCFSWGMWNVCLVW